MVRGLSRQLMWIGCVLVSACTLAAGLDELEFAPPQSSSGGAGGGALGGGGNAQSAGGGGGTGMVTFTDDELAGEFGEGTFEGSAYEDERLRLAVGQPRGTFVSRVFDAGADNASWLMLEWSPDAPYDKPLPDDGESESGYVEGAADMTDNILLLHLDGTDPVAHGSLVAESSGKGHTPTAWHASMGSMSYVPGVFGEAIDSTLDDHLYVDVPAASEFDFGTGDFTWGLWVKTTQDCGGAKTWMGIENELDVHLWLGCWDETGSCCGSSMGSYSGGYFVTGAGDDECYCGTSIVGDDIWHHVMMVTSGHDNAEIRLYVDGVRESTTPMNMLAPIVFDDTRFTLGAFDFYPPGTPTHISFAHFDEVVVFTRALTDAEVHAMYRRAQLRLRFQVRVCAEDNCADAPPFVGPDGSASTFYSDVDDVAPPRVPLEGLPAGRFFQYRAELETFSAGDTPALRHVTIIADR